MTNKNDPKTSSIDSDNELNTLYQIRCAVDDPYGKLMQDELVNRVIAMRDTRNVLLEVCRKMWQSIPPKGDMELAELRLEAEAAVKLAEEIDA